jgi:outer membrane protein OmpA-like peptidoglycan-associated protein
MKTEATFRFLFPAQIAALVLASAMAMPATAQQAQPAGDPQNTPPVAAQQPSTSNSSANLDKEGFWGHMNPFARKKWVNKRTDPLKDRLSELDELNAKNSKDIQDVDARAQAGIHQAQSTADSANSAALAAGDQARKAGDTAQNASGHVDQLNTTVNGIDQYHQISDVDVPFRGGQPVLSIAARKQLDDLAANLAGHQGYILEMEGHSPGGGSVGIQHSARLTEAVKRYLVTEHQVPVYRLHSVAMGNAKAATTGDEDVKPVHVSSVHIRLMENSLAAQDSTSPHGVASSTGAERP